MIALLLLLVLSGCAAAPKVLPRVPVTIGTSASTTVVVTQPLASASVLTFDGVGVAPKTVDLTRNALARISFVLSRSAEVGLDLVDEEGVVVRHLNLGNLEAGRHAALWDGHNDRGQRVPSGVYRYVLGAQAVDGQSATYNPSEQTGGEELDVRDFAYDKPTGQLRWIMPRAGRARLRVGIEGFPHLNTLLDWEPFEAGPQRVIWDGLDESGLIRVEDHSHLSIKLSAFALPDNTIIVQSPQLASAKSSETAQYPPDVKMQGYLHARHRRIDCGEVGLRVEFPESARKDAKGRPIVSGKIPVRVSLRGHNMAHTINQRFEVMLYEDLTALFEEEDSLNPFTFMWDTTRLTPGSHLLTVNILSYDDHFGVSTVPVVVEASPG